MINSPRDVVVTGMGVVSPIGVGLQPFWESLQHGRSGVEARPEFSTLPVKFGGTVTGFDAKQYVRPRKSLKVMCHEIQMANAAAVMAFEQAALEPSRIAPERFGVVLGSEMHYTKLPDMYEVMSHCSIGGQFDFTRWGEHFMRDISPLFLLKYLPNMAACHIAIGFDARGPINSIVIGESSSLLATLEAADVIRRGWADVMFTGGVGSRVPIGSILFRGDSNLSHRHDDPAAASRPFDKSRDGMVNGEGAGVFVLESRQHAEARGAAILARLFPGGTSFGRPPAGHGTTPRAIAATISDALARSGLAPCDLGHVNANGVSTIEADAIEAQVIDEMLGDVPATAPKSFFGNLGAGTGAVEMAATILAFQKREIPLTLNYKTPDPNCPINVVSEPTPHEKPTAMLLNQSGTGQTVALALIAD